MKFIESDSVVNDSTNHLFMITVLMCQPVLIIDAPL